jgi:hypothetical protein
VPIVSVAVTAPEFGVTAAGLNAQLAKAGRPLHEKLIGLVNEPCEVTVRVKTLD